MYSRRAVCGLLLCAGLLPAPAEAVAEEMFQLPVRKGSRPVVESQPDLQPATAGAVRPVAASGSNPFAHRLPAVHSSPADESSPEPPRFPVAEGPPAARLSVAGIERETASSDLTMAGSGQPARPAAQYLADTGAEGDLPPFSTPGGAPVPPLLPPPPEAAAASSEKPKEEGKKKEDKDDKKKTLEERLKDLESKYKKLQEEDEDLADTIKHLVHPGSSSGTMKLSGRIHLDYWSFPGDSQGVNVYERGRSDLNPEDRFAFRRMRFGVAGDISPNMLYKIEMEFAGGNDVEYRDAYLGFEELPVLRTLLIGNQKRPYGLDHLNSSRYNVFLERPFIIEAFNQDARRLGVASYGHSEDEVWNWRYGVYNQRLIQDESGHINDHYQLEAAARLATTFWYDEDNEGRNYGHFAVSGTRAYPNGLAPNNGVQDNEARFRHRPEARSTNRWIDTGRIAGANFYTLNGLEGVLNVGPVQVVGEYQNVWLDRTHGFGRDLHFHGGYAYISYFLTGEHMPWDRKTGTLARIKPKKNFFLVHRDSCDPCEEEAERGWGAWQVAARISHGDLSDRDILGGVGDSVTLGLNWYWNPQARLQINYINGRISDRPDFDPATGETITGGDYEIFGTRASVDF